MACIKAWASGWICALLSPILTLLLCSDLYIESNFSPDFIMLCWQSLTSFELFLIDRLGVLI